MCSLLILLLLGGCSAPEPDPEPAPPPPDGAEQLALPVPASWPSYGSFLARQEVDIPINFGTRRVFLDAGHGAVKNEGNSGVRCQTEQDHTLLVAKRLHARLTAHPNFTSKMSRTGTGRPSYTSRVQAAKSWRADVFLSFHSDARADATPQLWPDGRQCLRNDTDPGFAILWSNEGDLGPRRHKLAQRIAIRMDKAGIVPYHGLDYGKRYDRDPSVPGVFSDNRGLLVLRRPEMPSVIIETHHALDLNEVERWDEERTHLGFEDAIIAAMVDALSPTDGPPTNP